MNIKYCPFCGSKYVTYAYAPMHMYTDKNEIKYTPLTSYVYCQECGCSTSNFSTKEQAIAMWNTRYRKE
jgi:Lar family restriction alleviation protein